MHFFQRKFLVSPARSTGLTRENNIAQSLAGPLAGPISSSDINLRESQMIKRYIERMRRHRLRIRAARQLHELSDFHLQDIGLDRGMIEDVI